MFARKTLLIVVSNVISGVLGWAALFFISRFMNPDEIGIVGFAIGFVGLFRFIVNSGFSYAHMKRVSEGRDFGVCNGTYISIISSTTLIAVSTALASIFIWTKVLGEMFETPQHIIAIYLILIYFVLNTLSTIPTVTFNARREIAKSQIPVLAQNIVRSLAMIAFALLALGVYYLAVAYILGGLTSFIIGYALFRTYPVRRPTRAMFSKYFSFALPMFFAATISTLVINVDKVMIQYFWDATHVGYYFPIQNFVNGLMPFTIAVATLLFPTISASHAKDRHADIIKLTSRAERYLSMITAPIAVFFIVFPREIIHILLSDKILPGAPVLQFFGLFLYFHALKTARDSQLSGMGFIKTISFNSAVTMGLNLILNLFFIPRSIGPIQLLGLGATGAAMATAISILIGTALSYFFSKRLTGVGIKPNFLTHISAAMAVSIPLFFLGRAFGAWRFYHLLFMAGVMLLLYTMVLIIVREFSKEDWKMVLDAIHPVRMWRYIKGELKNEGY